MNQDELRRLVRRETLLKLAATGALGAGGILGLVREALAAGSLPATPGFRAIKGPVGVDSTRASVGLNVKPGQTVMTGEGGEAIYVIGPDAFLQREKTRVKFEEAGGAAIMRVLTGKILSVFGKGRDNGKRNLSLITPTATIGIRGTGAYIEAEEARTYFCLCYGEAEVTPTGDPRQKESYRTEHHDHPIFITAQGDKLMAPATVFNHTDAELTLLENTMGRWPPFHGKGYKAY